MKQSPDDMARLWVAQFDERLGWLDGQLDEMTLPEMVAVLSALEQRNKKLSDYLGVLRDNIAVAMNGRGMREATTQGLNGEPLVVSASRKPRRSNIDRDTLIPAVERAAASRREPNRETGELEDMASAILRTIKQVFRFEPRWKELGALGIDSDEYCETAWSNSVTIKEGAEL